MNRGRTNHIFLSALIAVMLMTFVIPVITQPVLADSSVSISGGEGANVGETFTINVTYSAESISRVDGSITYDTSKLTYLSGGTSSGNTGYIQIKEYGSGEEISFNIKFKAVSEGSTELNVETFEMYDVNDEYLNTPSASMVLDIAAATPEAEEMTEEESSVSEDAVKDFMDNGEDEKSGFNFWILGGVAVFLILMIILIAVKLKRK